MAVITPYISAGIRAGQPVALKVHKRLWRTVGQGQVKAVSDFEIEIDGRVKLAVYQGDLHIRAALLDQDEAAITGPCSLKLNSAVDDQASYRTHDDGLTISARMNGKDVQIRLSRFKSDNMTECTVSGVLDLTAYIEPAPPP
jgi:hypothetical protein